MPNTITAAIHTPITIRQRATEPGAAITPLSARVASGASPVSGLAGSRATHWDAFYQELLAIEQPSPQKIAAWAARVINQDNALVLQNMDGPVNLLMKMMGMLRSQPQSDADISSALFSALNSAINIAQVNKTIYQKAMEGKPDEESWNEFDTISE